jgi:hypothetical protein
MQPPTIIYRVYKHTSISGNAYIGYTKLLMMERWKGEVSHSRNPHNNWKIDKALRKYPNKDQWNNKVLIDNIPTLAEAKRLEIKMIAKYDTYKNGYNSTPGGDGHGPKSKETKKKISEGNKNKPKSEEHKKHLKENHADFSGKNNPSYGKEYNTKTYQITFPNGSKIIIKNLRKFCRENNLNNGAMVQIAKGKVKTHKGFKCSKIIT